MASMFPPEPGPSTVSNAEKRLFDFIRDDLADDWIALHSLGMANHPRKHRSEIDFVLIGPPGVYCIEVKGGRVMRRDGAWHFINRHDETSAKREGPFEQVGSAAHALREYLLRQFPEWMHETVVGWGVAFPDIEFRISGPDMEPRIVYDARDGDRRFSVYMRRLADYWHEKLESSKGKPIGTLTSLQTRQILEVLRGDFDLRPSLKTRIKLAKDELIRLTEEQYRVLEGLVANKRMLIRGSAGTGKTVLAIEEARRLARAGKTVFFCCYNRQLASSLRIALADEPAINVSSLHGFMKQVVDEAGIGDRLPPASDSDLFALFYPELAVEALLEAERLGEFDALVIDEGQDLLLMTYLEVFEALLKGGMKDGLWRVFLDHTQDIFSGTAPQALQATLSHSPAQFTLGVNCRNTKPIAVMTRMVSGAGSTETLKVEGPEIEEHWCRDASHQLRAVGKCLNRLLSEGISPSDIVILSRYRIENSVLREGIPDTSISIGLFDFPARNDRSAAVRFATVQSFKGLESDVVLFVDIDNLTSREALGSFYVGSSRAGAYLALFMDQSQKGAYVQRAEEYGRQLKSRFS